MPDAGVPYPIGRITGGQVWINLECKDSPLDELSIGPSTKNDQDKLAELQKLWQTGKYDSFCAITVSISTDVWAYAEERSVNASGHTIISVNNGLRVTCRTFGHFKYWDPNRAFLNFTSALVILGLLRTFSLFIAV